MVLTCDLLASGLVPQSPRFPIELKVLTGIIYILMRAAQFVQGFAVSQSTGLFCHLSAFVTILIFFCLQFLVSVPQPDVGFVIRDTSDSRLGTAVCLYMPVAHRRAGYTVLARHTPSHHGNLIHAHFSLVFHPPPPPLLCFHFPVQRFGFLGN